MEDALRVNIKNVDELNSSRLNPCSNGRCSARNLSSQVSAQVAEVLILVLMEDALRVFIVTLSMGMSCLNPCSNGRCSARINLKNQEDYQNSLNPCSNGRCSARSSCKVF